ADQLDVRAVGRLGVQGGAAGEVELRQVRALGQEGDSVGVAHVDVGHGQAQPGDLDLPVRLREPGGAHAHADAPGRAVGGGVGEDLDGAHPGAGQQCKAVGGDMPGAVEVGGED